LPPGILQQKFSSSGVKLQGKHSNVSTYHKTGHLQRQKWLGLRISDKQQKEQKPPKMRNAF